MKHRKLLLLALVFTCTNAQNQSVGEYLETTTIKALISPQGNHFMDYEVVNGNPDYSSNLFIPKSLGATTIFASGMWVGSLSETNVLHVAGQRFDDETRDYFAGPYSTNGSYDTTANSDWNRVWVVSRAEIQTWLNDPYQNQVPQSVLDWPAHGDPNLGQSADLAPFVDMDNDGEYDPVNDFDYPAIKGDQCVLFIYNDDGISHTETGGDPMGVEVMGMAYAFDCTEDTALSQTLFMEYNITNRSNNAYHDCYVGLWSDFNLGNAQDDYVASDPTRNLFYVYQGDDDDQSAGGNVGYGTNAPAQGIRVLNGIQMDLDVMDNAPSVGSFGNYYGFGMSDQIVDNERLGLCHFMFHSNTAGPIGDPITDSDYYLMMSGYWKDSTQLTFSGNGYDPLNPNAVPARFMFADSVDGVHYNTYGVDPGETWTEVDAGNNPADRRGMGSMGPFSLASGTTVDFTIAYVFAQKEGDRLGAVAKMKAYSDQVQGDFDAGVTSCGSIVPDIALGVDEKKAGSIRVYPNPVSDYVTVTGITSAHTQYEIKDIQGRVLNAGALNADNSKVSLKDMVSGVYLIEIKNGGSSQTLKVVKE